MYGVASSTKKSQIKGKKQLEDVTSSVDYITKKFDEYEEERKKKDEQIKMFARVCVFSGKQKRWDRAADRKTGTVLQKEWPSETWYRRKKA